MSHNTTSWQSHRSTGRGTAGNDGRSPAGGKCPPAWRAASGWGPPPPSGAVAWPLARFLQDPCNLTAFAWHSGCSPSSQPSRSGGDAMRVGRHPCAARGPGPPQGSKLFAEDPVIRAPLEVRGAASGLPAGPRVRPGPHTAAPGAASAAGRALVGTAADLARERPGRGGRKTGGPPPVRRPGWGPPGGVQDPGGPGGTQRDAGRHALLGRGPGAPRAQRSREVASVRWRVPPPPRRWWPRAWRGQGGAQPGRERSPRARLVARREEVRRGPGLVASAGRVAGLAFGPPGVFTGDDGTTSMALRGNTAEGFRRLNIPQS